MLKTNRRHNNHGFTLIEILVALFLVTIILNVVSTGSFSSRKDLDQIANDIERAIRFCGDEAILKNGMLRVKINTESEELSYVVEYSTQNKFILKKSDFNYNRSSKLDAEKAKDKKEKRSSNFSKVLEFSDGVRDFPANVKFMGMGLGLTKNFEVDGDPALYIFPTGEKDSAIIILATDEEILTLTINPFSQDIERTYFTLPESDDELEDQLRTKAEELYKEWLKD